MIILDLTIFAIPILLFTFSFFRNRKSLREFVISKFEKDRNVGMKGVMKQGPLYFLINSTFFWYAFLRADLEYLWLLLAIVFFAGFASITSFLIYQRYIKIDIPEFPELLSEEDI